MRKKHIAPQKGFYFPDEPFRLVAQTAIDGDRVKADAKRKERDQAESEKHQIRLEAA